MPVNTRNVIGCVFLLMNKLRRCMEQVGRLDFTCMKTIGSLLGAYSLKVRARRAKKREGTQAEFGAQVACQHIYK